MVHLLFVDESDMPSDAVFADLAAAPITCFVVVLRTVAAGREHPELVGSDEAT